MGIRCGFFNSVNKDRLYPAEDMNKPYELLVSNGVFATQKGTPSNYLQVLGGNGMTLTIKAGRGIFSDKWFVNDSDISIAIEENNNIVPRIDSVIVRIDNRVENRAGDIIVLKGTPASSPVAPAINNVENVNDYRLANIYVAPNITILTQDVITDKRGTAECPWVTSLIQQVDTSTLFLQYETAFSNALQKANDDSAQMISENDQTFEAWFTESQAAAADQIVTNQSAFDTWFNTVKETLKSNTLIRSYHSVYVTTAANEMIIPINITQFNKELDILQVYVNGIRLVPDVDYTVDSNEEVTLIKDVYMGTPVSFEVFKSIDGTNAETVVQLVYELQTQMNQVVSDSGWMELTLENNVSTFDNTTMPSVRRSGNTVYIRGAITGADSINTTIATLSENMRPAMTHWYPVTVISDNQNLVHCVFEIQSTGDIILIAKSGMIPEGVLIPISTQFIIG